MTVYFIRAGADGLLKIGHTVNVASRLKQLQAGCPAPLVLLRQIGGGQPTEAWLHVRFAQQRRHGEWFAFVNEMLTIEPPTFDRPAPPVNAHPVLSMIERFLLTSGMSAKAFGEGCLGDPRFVYQLRLGREPQRRTVKKTVEFVERGAA